MTKQIENNLNKILKGLNTAADIIISTMGAEGKNVIIQSDDGLKFTKDGVSVAKEIQLEDPIENIGAKMLISAANKTVEHVGDGTTFTSLMLKTMVNSVLKEIEDKNINVVLEQLEIDIQDVLKQLEAKTHKLETLDEIKKIATTSSRSEKIGELFKDIYSQTGFDALVTVEKSEYSDKTYFEKVNGIQFDSGFIHPSFMTNTDDETAIYENAYIHIADDPLTSVTDEYKNLMQVSYTNNIPLIIIAPRFSESFFRTVSMNKVNQGVQVCLIKTPGHAYGVKKNIDDINAFLNNDGTVDRIFIDAYKFILYNENPPNLSQRIEQLKKLRDSAVEWYDEKDYNDRLHKLQGSSAVIFVGGVTKESRSEEFDRVEDALGAVKSAIVSGYIEGGGKTLLELSTKNKSLSECLSGACRQILKNANEPESLIEEIKAKNLGYNVKTKQFENFLESGIIDPASVVIQGLNNAFTNTKLLINTSFILNNEN